MQDRQISSMDFTQARERNIWFQLLCSRWKPLKFFGASLARLLNFSSKMSLYQDWCVWLDIILGWISFCNLKIQSSWVQIIQMFLLLTESKEKKRTRERTHLRPEWWCNQHGMLIDGPDNQTVPMGSLGASGPAGQCPHLWDLIMIISGAAEGPVVTEEPGWL